MSKAILMSIQPKWCELIISGDKTIEVRKARPKIYPPFKCYIYCTKSKTDIFWQSKTYRYIDDRSHNAFDKILNGNVIGEFTCNLITGLKADNGIQTYYNGIKETCLTDAEIIKYASGKMIYYWHISNLVIYDEPRELSGFYAPCPYKKRDGTRMNVPCPCDKYDWDYDEKTGKFYCTRRLTRPPQSWCYVEEISNES